MRGYYQHRLSGARLRQVYELASPRIRQYLEAETRHVVDRVRGANLVLELGCGYGRALREIAASVGWAIGNDTSQPNLDLALSHLQRARNCSVVRMNAVHMGFRDGAFDAVICIQNGISAFGEDRQRLVAEAARVTRIGGTILFSTYSPEIWSERLEWFRTQARAGLLGALDESRSTGGTIVCTDGFRSTTLTAKEFGELFAAVGLVAEIREVDRSSIFSEATKGLRSRARRRRTSASPKGRASVGVFTAPLQRGPGRVGASGFPDYVRTLSA